MVSALSLSANMVMKERYNYIVKINKDRFSLYIVGFTIPKVSVPWPRYKLFGRLGHLGKSDIFWPKFQHLLYFFFVLKINKNRFPLHFVSFTVPKLLYRGGRGQNVGYIGQNVSHIGH
jgi:hypothetical protein